MVAKKKKKIGIVVYADEMNSEEFLVEALSQLLGYDITQTGNCVNIIMSRGSYLVKTFDNIDTATAISQLIVDQGIPTEIIFI
jgi:hypothetical protein